MTRSSFTKAAAISALAALLGMAVRASVADAAEIKVLSTVALKAAIDEEFLPKFEHSTENKVTIKYGAAAALKQQIEAGETFDLAILTPALADDLIKQGKIDPGSRRNIATRLIRSAT